MKHIVRRLIAVWQHDKAEAWLNEMSAKGLQLVDINMWKFTFVDGGHSEHTYRLNFMNYYNRHETMEYVNLTEEMGIEYIGTSGWWGYFRRKSSDEPFVLYSNNASKIKHYLRMQNVMICSNIVIIANLFNSFRLFRELADSESVVFLCFSALISLISVAGLSKVNKIISKLKKDSGISE